MSRFLMLFRNVRFPTLVHASLLIGLLAITACRPTEKTAAKSASQNQGFRDGLTAAAIWEETQLAYRNAKSYRDQAVLCLSYVLDGQVIQEEQPWNLIWQLGPGPEHQRDQIAANWYNAEIRTDGQRLGCFVYNIDTGNLDDQWLVMDEAFSVSIDKLFSDAIAAYYAGGDSELPLGPTPDSIVERLVPPALGLLTGEMKWKILSSPDSLIREPDAKVDGRACYHLLIASEGQSLECWIDQETKLIRQMNLPKGLLDPIVTGSNSVGQLQFFARMHGAQFNQGIAADTFAVMPPRDATAVQQFVAVPEAFPCEKIGQQVEELRLFQADGEQISGNFTEGKTTCLIWLAGLTPTGLLARLGELRESVAALALQPDTQVFVVVADDQLDFSDAKPKLSGIGSQIVDELGLTNRWLYDQGLMVSQEIRLSTLPAVVVIGKDSTIEYARTIADSEWGEFVVAAVERTQRGEHVSQEMKQDYTKFLERYSRKLQLVSADKILGRRSRELTAPSVVATQLSWRNSEIRHAGNLCLAGPVDQPSLAVLEGWQSICELDLTGKLVRRVSLDLPAGDAVDVVESIHTVEGSPRYLAFTRFGHRAFVFDQDWKRLRTITATDNESFQDCHLVNWKGKTVLAASLPNEGTFLYEIESDQRTKLSGVGYDSLVADSKYIVGLKDGMLTPIASSDDSQRVGESILSQATYVRALRNTVNDQIMAVGVNSNSEWKLVMLDALGDSKAEFNSEPQIFDDSLIPLSAMSSNGQTLGLSLSAFGKGLVIDCINQKELGTVELGSEIRGMMLIRARDQWGVVVSDSQGVSLKILAVE